MFKFAHPDYLYLFSLLPLVLLLYVVSEWRAHRRWQRLGTRDLLLAQVEERSRLRPIIKLSLLCVAIVLGVLLLARPQFGTNTGTERRKGIEAIIALDVSQSMLAQDVQPSRMERSKLLISTLVDRMRDDKVGLVVFAGEAYPQLPITNDFVSARLFLDQIEPGMVSLQGTNVGAAIELASKSFTQEKEVGKAIIVITDGESHEPGAVDAAKKAAQAGRRVYVLGVGTSQGGEIPTPEGPLTDRSGKVVYTRLNEQMCRDVAKAGQGVYIHLDGSNVAQDELQLVLRQLQQSDSGMVSDGSLDEQFQAVALLMLLTLVVELILFERKNPFFRRFRLFQR